MAFHEILLKARFAKGVSQETMAAAVGVSRQAIQKWESGAALPATENLVALAAYLDLSLDYLLCGKDNREPEQMRLERSVQPAFDKWHVWEAYYRNLETEYRQTVEEGKDIAAYKAVFDAVSAMPDGKDKADMADILYRVVENAPMRADFPYDEPSDLAGIRAGSALTFGIRHAEKDEAFAEKVRGAWYGRICGCLLGKPVEGMRRGDLKAFLARTDNLPMHRYIVKSEAAPLADAFTFPIARRAYDDGVLAAMPADDDTNYIVIAHKAVETFGRDFTSAQMAQVWVDSQSKNAYCTAERAAYRNFVNGYLPPESARCKNPYREWIGAQIRGDYFGWINPGDPLTASEMAFRDACMSHVANGIYGEMWVAASLAIVGAGVSPKEAIREGLAYIPRASRLHEALMKVHEAYESGQSAEDFFADFHKRWNDAIPHHWCHTISNAEIVTAAVLWGGEDYGRAVCLAVEQGFDTDCNGATVGSLMGFALGKQGVGRQWTEKISGKLDTTVFGFGRVDVDAMAAKTLSHLPA